MTARPAFIRFLLPVFALSIQAWGAPDATQLEFFENKIRPILVERCFECHSTEQQKSDLRLDHISLALVGGERGPALVPGNSEKSLLVEAIEYINSDYEMPPKTMLDDVEIDLLIEWIDMGAPWPEEPVAEAKAPTETFDLQQRKAEHWAWQPARSVNPPEVKQTDWSRNGTDNFILSKLEEASLSPGSEASRTALIRRLYFDLIGLPPTPEEVENFLQDNSPKAYEKLVDGLLASPHFGERWGRHWLDLMRYSETYGHEQDYPIRNAWPYRDYVIRSLNDDVPYDRFVQEHLAGDLLKPRIHSETGINESVLGTGWWYMHQATHAPVDVLKDEADRIDNQIDVFGKAFLGMTVACARCHEHKFDAISTKDYYALSGFLRSSRQLHAMLDPFGNITATADTMSKHYDKHIRKSVKSAKSLQKETGTVAAYIRSAQDGSNNTKLDADRVALWAKLLEKKTTKATDNPLHPLVAEDFKSRTSIPPVGEIYETFDGSDYGDWYVYGKAFGDRPTLAGEVATGTSKWPFTPSGVAHSGRVSRKLEGVLRSPTFIIGTDRVQVRAAGDSGRLRLVIARYQLADDNGLLFNGAVKRVNTNGEFRWFDMSGGISKFKGCHAYLEFLDDGDGYVAVDEVRFSDEPLRDINLGTRIVDGASPDSLADAYEAATSVAVEHQTEGVLTPDDASWLNFLYSATLMDFGKFQTRLEKMQDGLSELSKDMPRPVRAVSITDGTTEPAHVFIRGNHTEEGDATPRRFMEALSNSDDPLPIASGSGRLELAELVASGENPLTARVMVNRVWHHLFGRGIVASLDNFGVLGTAPSHPELLDYLTVEFVDSGWSVKELIRDLVTSSTYRMSSALSDTVAEEQDPANVLLHRMNVKRLEGEIIRDTLLAVSGELDATIYGESIPAHLYEFMTYSRRPGVSGPMDGELRRSIYQRIQRNFLSPMMLAFDMPLPDTALGKRTVSNVPAQSLILMNDPFVIDRAKTMGEALTVLEVSTNEKLDRLFMTVFGRAPSDEEVGHVEAFGREQAKLYEQDSNDWASNAQVLADICQSLFMAKEFIYIG